MRVATGQSDRVAAPGNIVTLTAEVSLPQDVHVYAPGTKGYKPIRLIVDPSTDFDLKPESYPRSKILFLPAIKERVPVFENEVFDPAGFGSEFKSEFSNALSADGKNSHD